MSLDISTAAARHLKSWHQNLLQIPGGEHQSCALLATVLLLAATIGGIARAEIVEIAEDFSTTTLQDATWTTADWDTVGGVLELHPAGLAPRGDLATSGTAFASVVVGQHVLLADGTGGLLSIEVTDPDSPTQVDNLATADQAHSIVAGGSWAYLAIGASGMQTVNISDPADLIAGGTVDTDGFARGVAHGGDWVYVAESNLGIAVVNVADPLIPINVIDHTTNDWARGVALQGDLLFVADGAAGLTIVDVSTPTTPITRGNLGTADTCFGVAVDGDRAYLAAGTAGLIVVDVSDPIDPWQVGELDLAATCRHVAVAGDTLFVAASDGGLFVVDVTNPTEPTVVGQQNTDGTAYHTALATPLAFLCDGPNGLLIFEADPDGLDLENNEARSVNLNPSGEPVSRARLVADISDSVAFELSVDGGLNWDAVNPDDSWHTFAESGTDLRWRALLTQTGGPPGPQCQELTVTFDRLHSYAEITEIADVPGDTGGQVRIIWDASRFDVPGAEETVTEYSIYRRYADPALRYPPGDWDYLLTVPADREEHYAAVVPTLGDSSGLGGLIWSVYFVRTRTSEPGVFHDSPPDSGYSINNLQPAPPSGFHVDRTPPDGAQLTWYASADPDFAHFRVYRSVAPETPPGPGTLHHTTTDTEFFDLTTEDFFYQLTVVNLWGQESEPAYELSPVPESWSGAQLRQNSPNPFNPQTEISFTVPAGGAAVRLEIFDARGRLVTTLVDETLVGGEHRRPWNGRLADGRTAASGLYTCRLRCGEVQRSMKMSLVR